MPLAIAIGAAMALAGGVLVFVHEQRVKNARNGGPGVAEVSAPPLVHVAPSVSTTGVGTAELRDVAVVAKSPLPGRVLPIAVTNTPSPNPSLKDVATARGKPGYATYKYSVLATMGWSEDYANGVIPPLPPNGNTQFSDLRTSNEAAATKALGLSVTELRAIAHQMSDDEWLDFWLLGVVPNRFAPPGSDGVDTIGGWHSPYVGSVTSYGLDGGMWNAVLTFWQSGASTVVSLIPVVGGIGSKAISSVKINTRQNKFGDSK